MKPLKIIKIIFFSHHPDCKSYDNDVITIKNLKLCTGCYIALPLMILVIKFLPETIFFSNVSFKSLLFLGFIIAFPYLILKLPFGNKKYLQYISKIFIGVGGGFIFTSFYKLNLTEFERDLLVLMVQFIVVWGHLALRGLAFYKTCNKCSFNFDWDKCPGFN